MFRRWFSFLVCFCFIFEQTGWAQTACVSDVSAIAAFNAGFRPVHMRALELDPVKPGINVMLDRGDRGDVKPAQEAGKLLEYLRLGLAIPDSCFWVNLRPDSPDNVIDPLLENTDAGRILLEADLQLKKDFSLCTSPETAEGKQYWERLYAKADQLCPGMAFSTVVRPWIVPGEIILAENPGGVFIYKATLTVMLEQDYIKDTRLYQFDDQRKKEINAYAAELMRSMVLPKMNKAVNSSRKYAELRQLYYSLIIAQWYKKQGKKLLSPLFPVIDSGDTAAFASKKSWSKKSYYEAYQHSFRNGEYYSAQTRYGSAGSFQRSYVSGGITLDGGTPFALLNSREFLAGQDISLEEFRFGEGMITAVAKSPVTREEMMAAVSEAALEVTNIDPQLDSMPVDVLAGWYSYCRQERRVLMNNISYLRNSRLISRLDRMPLSELLMLNEEFNRETGRPLSMDLQDGVGQSRQDAVLTNRFANALALSLLMVVTLQGLTAHADAGEVSSADTYLESIAEDMAVEENVTYNVDLDKAVTAYAAATADNRQNGVSYERYIEAKEELARADDERAIIAGMVAAGGSEEEALRKHDERAVRAQSIVREYESSSGIDITVSAESLGLKPGSPEEHYYRWAQGILEFESAKREEVNRKIMDGQADWELLRGFEAEIFNAKATVRRYQEQARSMGKQSEYGLRVDGDVRVALNPQEQYNGKSTVHIEYNHYFIQTGGFCEIELAGIDAGDGDTLVMVMKDKVGANLIRVKVSDGEHLVTRDVYLGGEWQRIAIPLAGTDIDRERIQSVQLEVGGTVSLVGADLHLAEMKFVEAGALERHNLGDLARLRDSLDEALEEYREIHGVDFDFNGRADQNSLPMSLWEAYRAEARMAAINGAVGGYLQENNDIEELLPQDPSFAAADLYAVYKGMFFTAREEWRMYDVAAIAEYNVLLERELVRYESAYHSSYYTDLEGVSSRIESENEALSKARLACVGSYESEGKLLHNNMPLTEVMTGRQFNDLQRIARLHLIYENALGYIAYMSNEPLIKFTQAGHDVSELMSPMYHGGFTRDDLKQWANDRQQPNVPKDLQSIMWMAGIGFNTYLWGPGVLSKVMETLGTEKIARALGVHGAAAARLRQNPAGMQHLAQRGYRRQMNYLALMLGREYTDFRDQRADDPNTQYRLVDYLFERHNLGNETAVFDRYFKNDPDAYHLNETILGEIENSRLLAYINLGELRYLIRLINDDPRKDLDTIIANIRLQIRYGFTKEQRRQILDNVRWVIQNFYVLQRALTGLEDLTYEDEVEDKLIEVLQKLNNAVTLEEIVSFSRESDISSVALLRAKFGLLPWFQTCGLIVETMRRLPEMGERHRIEVADVVFSAVIDMNARSRLQLLIRLAQNLGPAGVAPAGFLSRLLTDYEEQTAQLPLQAGEDNREAVAVMMFLIESMDEPSREQLKSIVLSGQIEDERKSEVLDAFANEVEDGDVKKAQGKKKTQPGRVMIDALLKEKKALAPVWQDFRAMVSWIREGIAEVSENRIPHVYYLPLLQITRNPDDSYDTAALESFRRLITTKKSRDADTAAKSDLLRALHEFGALDISAIPYQGRINKANIFRGVLEYLQNSENAAIDDLRVMLKKYMTALDIYCKAGKNEVALYDESRPGVNLILEVSETFLSAIITDGVQKGAKPNYDQAAYLRLTQMMNDFLPAEMAAIFKGVEGIDISGVEPLLLEYVRSGGLDRRDPEGNHLFALIKQYLGNKTVKHNEEIFSLLWEALAAEAKGGFSDYRYSSADYSAILQRIASLDGTQPSQGQGAAQAIDLIWRADKQYSCMLNNERYTVEVEGSFMGMLSVGNSRHFASCQRVDGSLLNRGLMGYVHNGTVKAVVLRNQKGEIVSRRIVRLLTAVINGVERPVIFVEENSSFNNKGKDELYAALQIMSSQMSAQSGLEIPVVIAAGTYFWGEMDVFLPRGRSLYGYSDRLGDRVDENLGSGLYHQQSDVWVKTPIYKVFEPAEEPNRGGLKEIVDGKTYGSLFDLRWRELDEKASLEEVRAAESDPEAAIIKVIKPSKRQINELRGQGYFLKPGKISYDMQIPEGQGNEVMDAYYGRLSGSSRSRLKRDVARIEDGIKSGKYRLVRDEGGRGEYTKQFIEFYEEQMGAKERGRTPLLNAVKKYNGDHVRFIEDGRMGLYLLDGESGRMLGGIIVKVAEDHYSIGFEATATARDRDSAGDIPRNISFYLTRHMIEKSAETGKKRLNKGVDTNFYGHHLSGGLAQAKARVQFKPRVPNTKDRELIKITDYSNFRQPVFFYSFNEDDELESTLIIRETMTDSVDGYRGITATLNVYVLQADGSLQPWDGNTGKDGEVSGGGVFRDGGTLTPKTAPGGVDFRRLPLSGAAALPAYMPSAQKTLLNLAKGSAITDTAKEWKSIQREMLISGISYDRLSSFVAVCLVKGDNVQLVKAVSCIMNILRDEETKAEPTPRPMKELLALLVI